MKLNRLVAHDKTLSQRAAQQANQRRIRFPAWLVTRSGDSWLWVAISALLIRRKQLVGWKLLIIVLETIAVVLVSKRIFKRKRPRASRRLIVSGQYAFPSGHASRSAAVAVTLGTAYPWLGPFLFLWAMLVAVARVLRARHHLFDVLTGSVIGTLVAAGMHLLWWWQQSGGMIRIDESTGHSGNADRPSLKEQPYGP